MKNESHTNYYLPWKDAKTHIHLKHTKQKKTATNTSPNQNKQCKEFFWHSRVILMKKAKLILLLGNDLRNKLTVPYSN